MSSSLHNPYQNATGTWIRGNLHTHCREHSGCASVPLFEGIEKYWGAGARFLAVTDHDHVTDLQEARRRWPEMIFLEGFEWSKSENVLFIGQTVPPLHARPFPEALRTGRDLLTIVCHPRPSWVIEYWTVPMILALDPPPVGIEVYNGHYAGEHRFWRRTNPLYSETWDALLTSGARLWGFVNDDLHQPSDFGRTFTMACVRERNEDALLASLKAGRFYGSTGLLLKEVSVIGSDVHVALESPAAGRFVGPGGKTLASNEGTSFEYRAAREAYVRFEAAGEAGRIFLQPFFGRDRSP